MKSLTIPVLSLPAVKALAAPGVPRTTKELIEWFERTFVCEVGEPKAWHQHAGQRYRTYCLGAEVGQEERLVVSCFSRFSDVLNEETRGTAAYWRLPDKITCRINEWQDDVYDEDNLEVVASKTIRRQYLRFRAHFTALDDEKFFARLPEKNEGEKPEYV